VRILVLNWRDLTHPAAGGAEVYTEQVLRRWVAAGHEVTLFCARVDGRPAEEIINGYRVVRRGGRLGVYRAARTWWRAHGRGLFDLVIDEINTVPFFAHEWVDDGARTVALIHQTCEEIWHLRTPPGVAHLGRHLLEPRWLGRYRDRPVLTVSDSTREALTRFGVTDVTLVPEGYEPPPMPTAPKEERPTVVFCGRMVDYKRPGDTIKAFQLARTHLPELQLWMIGGGPLLDTLRATRPDGVHFHGRVSETTKYDLLKRAHVHVATSVREGWGLVVTEAAAMGTPTVAYDVPGLRDSTRAAAGVLAPARPAELARQLIDRIPGWQAAPPAPLAYGGAHSWDDVAAQVLDSARHHAR
jgi:glycosyltransferase involved in cell wall biosynthesis